MKISEILTLYGTDKTCGHKYGPYYDFLLEHRRGCAASILEIGIDQGHSLRAWRDAFPLSMIVGVDINPDTLRAAEGRIKTVCADVNDVMAMVQIGHDLGPFQIIIDDGSHQTKDQIAAACALRQFLTPGGVYVIEDVKPGNVPELLLLPGCRLIDGNCFTDRGDECLAVFGTI